jgi:superfamily II DNA or RNA helicase
MDLPDIELVVQWRASCNLMTLWQRLGRGARDRTYTATGVFLVEKEHFAEEREKKLKRQRVRKAKKQNTPLQSITNKRVRTESSTSQRVVANLEAIDSSSEESEKDELAVTQEPSIASASTTILELRHRYSTTVTAPRKKKSDPLEPAMDDMINARFRKLRCRKLPVQAYLEMNDICTYCCQLLLM